MATADSPSAPVAGGATLDPEPALAGGFLAPEDASSTIPATTKRGQTKSRMGGKNTGASTKTSGARPRRAAQECTKAPPRRRTRPVTATVSSNATDANGAAIGKGNQDSRNDSANSTTKLIFVEPYSNPLRDARRPAHRETVKRWSMLNRHVSLARPHATWDDTTSATTMPSGPLGSESATRHIAPATTSGAPVKGRLVPQKAATTAPATSAADGKSKPLTLRRRKAWLHAWNRACGLESAPCVEMLGCSSADPFHSLPIELDTATMGLVDGYLQRWRAPEQGGFRADGQHPARLLDARRFIWLPLALESEGASAALVAFSAASSQQDQLEQRLGRALQLTNRDLRNQAAAASNGVILSVALLMLVARCTGDTPAFEAHCQGIEILLKHRALDKSREDATGTAEDANGEDDCLMFGKRTRAPFTGQGFADVYGRGFISPHSWNRRWQTALRMSRLVQVTGQDLLWYSALQQHIWLISDEEQNSGHEEDAVDRLLSASLRLAWHMTIFRRVATRSPVIHATTRAIRAAVAELDLDVVGAAADWTLLWAAMVGGRVGGRQARWFGLLLKLALRRLGDMNYEEAVEAVEARFFWHEALEDGARRWWESSVRGASPPQEVLLAQLREKESCCGSGSASAAEGEAGVAEMDKMCLCAWWT